MAEIEIINCAKQLADKDLTIAFVESATAGWICSEFALSHDSGKVLKGGLVCYDAELKKRLLGVPDELIERYTPESAEVTQELARRLSGKVEADIYVAVTGLTRPGGSESVEKPVGTMFVSVLFEEKLVDQKYLFNGSCEDIIHQTVKAAAGLVKRIVEGK